MLVTAGQGGLTWTVTRGNNLAAPDTTTNTTHANNATVTHILTAGGFTNYVLNPEAGAAWGASALLTLTTVANSYGLTLVGPSGAGTSFGLISQAGTNSSDYSARFQTQALVDILAARGDGVVVIGGSPAQINMTGTGQAKIVGGTTGGVITNNANNANNFSWTDAGALTMRNNIFVPYQTSAPTTVVSNYGTMPVKIDDILVGTDARYNAATAQITFLNTSNSGTNALPTGFRHLLIEWYARGDTAAGNTGVTVRVNNISTATYDQGRVEDTNNTVAGVDSVGNTSWTVGFMPAATATANYFGQGEVKIKHYNGTVGNKIFTAESFQMNADTVGSILNERVSGKWRTTATAITRIDVLPTAGNFVVGSIFTLWGIP